MKQLASAAKHRSVAWTRMMPVAAALMVCLGLLAVTKEASSQVRAAAGARPYIVQGVTSKVAAAEVATAHGVVVSSLPIVHGVVARLTAGEADVARGSGLEVSPDLEMKVEDTGNTSSTASDVFNSVTSATSMWANGINGAGVTVAVLDTGIDTRLPDIGSRVIDGVNLINPKNPAGYKVDQYGHGTFVAGLIASNGQSSGGQYTGVAPGADLVAIKVAQASGVTTESLVIQGVAWAVAHETSDNIGVLNLSLGVAPGSPTALDPLDQAVEQAWESGIVVVTSAGNAGPGNGSITAPGDDPLVITVGSIADGGADVPANYTVPAFSSVGPTDYDGWFKPDLVAPGRSVVSLMAPASTIWTQNPQARIGSDNFVGSGTSFSAAIVSGLAALLLEQDPSLTPDQVKAALLMGADPGPVGDPLVDGHGTADVAAAAAVAGQVFLDQSGAAAAESATPGATVSLSSTWSVSTWNPSNWSGPAWDASPLSSAASNAPTTDPVDGIDWTGAAWNGAAWNGAAWNGAAWNGAAWNSSTWNDESWG
ncbi:MAG: S8 family peptidase [Acidimicrobiales bacterium]